MTLKQLILDKQIKERSSRLTELSEKRSEVQEKFNMLKRALEEAETDEEIETVAEGNKDIEKEVKELDEQIKELQEEKEKLEKELAEIEEKDEKTEDKKERNTMTIITTHEKGLETRSALNDFVKSKGTQTRNLTTVEGGALIPTEVLAPQTNLEDVVDLRNYVKVVTVNSKNGKYPVIGKAGSKMATVAELVANPKLANPTITEIDYSIATRRGYIPVSQEMLDDAEFDITPIINEEINDQSRNTANFDIATAFKGATAKAVVGIDGLKDLVNKSLKQVYNVKFFLSASLFAEIDKLKDGNERYLFQDSISSQSGKMLLGKEVIILDDDVIGAKAGDLVGFVGDAKEAVAYFDRKRATVEWVDNAAYGKLLAGVVRYDVQATDENAGFYITYTNAPAQA